MQNMDNKIQQWTISFFAVFGAFFLCGIFGSALASLLGLWDQATSGFFAAFGVVNMAYLSSPNRNKQYSVIVFLLGAICAWLLIGDSWYPESYTEKAYQSTYLPFLITLLGGLLPLVVIFYPLKSSGNEA
jgi:hypothetical protein